MTKYGKVRKLMKETGLSKKEATDTLRKCGWDYNTALSTWAFSKIDWNHIGEQLAEISKGIVETLTKVVEELPRIVESVASNLTEMVDRLNNIEEVKK